MLVERYLTHSAAFVAYGIIAVAIYSISCVKNYSPHRALRLAAFPAVIHIVASLFWTDVWVSFWDFIVTFPLMMVFRVAYAVFVLPFALLVFVVFLLTFSDHLTIPENCDSAWGVKYYFLMFGVVLLYFVQGWYIFAVQSALTKVS